MKVLIAYTQEFKSPDGLLKCVEEISQVLEAESNDDLLLKFVSHRSFVSHHAKKSLGIDVEAEEKKSPEEPKTEVIHGRKKMLWYLPENGMPIIRETKCAA